MVAVPKPSARARQQLPVLCDLIGHLAYVAARLPEAAAREMVLAVQYDHRRNVDPYGKAQAPVKMDRSRLGGMSRRYDAERHIADSYYPVVDGTDAIIESQHRASRALQKPFKRRPGRKSHPTEGGGLGSWGQRFSRMNRRLLIGARIGEEGRAKLKADAEARRIDRHTKRNEARVKNGLAPLKLRARRKDRARVDNLVRRAVG